MGKTTTAVVMVTMADRIEMLNGFLASLAEHGPKGVEVLFHVQSPGPGSGWTLAEWQRRLELPEGVKVGHLMWSEFGKGCHWARVELLCHAPRYSTYVNVDDDVELTEHTHWEPAIAKAQRPGVGFVLTNWARTPALMLKKVPKMEDKFLPQVMVYQGGGMAYTDAVAELMRQLPQVHARYDDLWPLTAYLAGYRNFRYMGSLAVHRIMVKGGMNAYMRATPRVLLAGDWIDYPYLTGGGR